MTAIEPIKNYDDSLRERQLLQTEDTISDDETTTHERASSQLEYMKLALDFKNVYQYHAAADMLQDESANNNTYHVKNKKQQQQQQNVDRDELYETNSVSSTGMSALQIIRRSTNHNNETTTTATARQSSFSHSIGSTSRGTSPARSRNGGSKKHLIHDRPRSSSWANLQNAMDAADRKESKKRETNKHKNRRTMDNNNNNNDNSMTYGAAPAGQSTFQGIDSQSHSSRIERDYDHHWDHGSSVPSSHDIIEYSFSHHYHSGSETIDIYDVGGSSRHHNNNRSANKQQQQRHQDPRTGIDTPRFGQSASESKEEESKYDHTYQEEDNDDDNIGDNNASCRSRNKNKNRTSQFIGYKLKNITERNINRRVVNFTTIQIRKYDQIIGDNPSCSRGPSVSLGWRYFEHDTIDTTVDDYEKRRPPRLDSFEMVMSRVKRESLLLKLGYSKQDIAEGVRANIKVKNQRRRTVNNLPVAKMEEAVENFKYSVKKNLCRGMMDATESFPVSVVTTAAVVPSRKGILKKSKSVDDLCNRKL